MLMLLFYVENDLYALDTSQVIEIVPKIILRSVRNVPEYFAGLFSYRGTIVPVIDLSYLIQGKPSRSYLSTRIIMVNYRGNDNNKRFLGLMAERVTETLKKPDSELVETGNRIEEASYLGEIIIDDGRMIQQIRLEHLLSDSQHKYLLAAGESQ